MKRGPIYYALQDIKEEIEKNEMVTHTWYNEGGRGGYDIWVVFGDHLITSEQRRLNRKLGLHTVNRGPHNMARHK